MRPLHSPHLMHTLRPGDHVLLALSGGPDSMALFDMLLKDASARGYTLEAIHFDHGLRPEASQEAAWVAGYAAARGIPCRVESLPVKAHAKKYGTGLEGAGHILRRTALERYRREIKADWILLGHHADDQAETLLLHLVRGSGLQGLTGMPPRRGQVLRPLLGFRKEALLAYCKKNSIPYITDASNFDTQFARNALRQDVIPLLEEQNPKVVESLCHTAEALRHDEALLQDLACQEFAKIAQQESSRVIFDRAAMYAVPTALRRRIFQQAVASLTSRRLSHIQHRELESALASIQGTPEIRIAGDASFWFNSREIVLEKRHDAPLPEEQIWDMTTSLEVAPYYTFLVKASLPRREKGHQGLWLPGPQLLKVRTRQPGDRVTIAGLGRKSLKKIHQEGGLSPYRRTWWPVICDAQSGDILWIPGLAVAKRSQLVDNCEDVGIYIKMHLL